jgi:hypothetical protein
LVGGGQARAADPAAPLAGSSSATLTQVNAAKWTTAVYLDTAALCTGGKPAANSFSLVTGRPDSVTTVAPTYPDGLRCDAAAAHPVTEVELAFTPSPGLSAVPQTATLTVTPPQSLLLAGDPPAEIPLTVRRTVSPWQYVGIPALSGGVLAVLLVLLLIAIGMPGEADGQVDGTAGRPGDGQRGRPGVGQARELPEHEAVVPGRTQAPGRLGLAVLLILLLVTKRHEAAGEAGAAARQPVAAVPAGEQPGAAPGVKRVRWGLKFWRTSLFAGAAWSFGDSWATSVTPLTALAGGVLTASGAVAGLVPGVDLSRIGLLMALAGGLTVLAPLLFGALNSLFPERKAGEPAPAGEVIAARLWVMLLASCLTVFAIGAEIGFVGLVLGFDLLVASPSIRWCAPAGAGLTALLFLAYGAHSILTLAGQPSGTPKNTARKSSFMI